MLARDVLVIVAVCALGVSAPAAAQAPDPGPTRAEFIADADEICHNFFSRAYARLHRASRRYFGQGRIKKAGTALSRAFRAAMTANDELREVGRPPADDVQIVAWLDELRRAYRIGSKSGHALKQKREQKSKALYRRAKREVRDANRPMANFGFKFCA